MGGLFIIWFACVISLSPFVLMFSWLPALIDMCLCSYCLSGHLGLDLSPALWTISLLQSAFCGNFGQNVQLFQSQVQSFTASTIPSSSPSTTTPDLGLTWWVLKTGHHLSCLWCGAQVLSVLWKVQPMSSCSYVLTFCAPVHFSANHRRSRWCWRHWGYKEHLFHWGCSFRVFPKRVMEGYFVGEIGVLVSGLCLTL